MDQIVNYRDLAEDEKDHLLMELQAVGFVPAYGGTKAMKQEMEQSEEGTLPQYVFVLREGRVVGYLFLIAEKENTSRAFPWWAVDNADELPLETDLRLLQYGIELCRQAGCMKLRERLQSQMENHKNGIGRRPQHLSR